jgi:peptidoglycan/LPS O-acetylase OafA/YrhL
MAATGTYPPFFHSWSLGIEEKFYLIWPLVAFALLHNNRVGRLAIASGIIAISYALYDREIIGLLKLPSYTCILVGCILAVLMEHRPYYNKLSLLASTPVHIASLALLVAVHLSQQFGQKDVYFTMYPYVVALFLIGLVAGRTPCTALFKTRVLSYLGLRTYGLYLVHVLAQNAVEMIAKPGPRVPLWSSPLYFLACLAVTLIAAEILHRTIEKPFIALGKRISNRIVSTENTPAIVDHQRSPLLPAMGDAQRE